MKKLQLMAWPKLCTAILLGTAALFMASCAKDELSGDSFNGTYGGSQLTKPDAATIKVTSSSDRSTQTVTWATVNGALSYIVNVTAGNTQGQYDEVVAKDVTVRGNSYSFKRTSRKYYHFTIATAFNPAENNTGSDPNDPAIKDWDTFSTDITIPGGTDLAKYFKENDPVKMSDGLPLMINLVAGEQYTAPDTLRFTGVNATITSDPDNRAKITFSETETSKGTIVTDNTLTVENVEINWDVTTNGAPMILLDKNPTTTPVGTNAYYHVPSITINNVKATDLKHCIFHDNNTKYCVIDFKITNSIFKLATAQVSFEALIAFQSGGAKDFTVEKSTFWGNNAIAKYFLRYNNSSRIDRYGFDQPTDTWSFTYQNNTFYGLLIADGQWGNYNGIVGKATQGIITITKNIWYNCDAQTTRRLLHSKHFADFNEASTMAENTFWRAGAAVDQETYGNQSDLTTEPLFVNAAEGDFTLNACDQKTKGCGDPRWLK
jgi:hypothetical protein